MSLLQAQFPWKYIQLLAGVVVIAVGGFTYSSWWPQLSNWIDTSVVARSNGDSNSRSHGQQSAEDANSHSHASPSTNSHSYSASNSHSHGSEPHSHKGDTHLPKNSIVLTRQARLNLGLTGEFLKPVKLTTYSHSLTVPAIVVPKPGRSKILVSSPLRGIVTHVHSVTGEAVESGDLLFEVRLTYEDLVETQTQYLKALSDLAVENREIERLEIATNSGAISGKSLLDRRYAKNKIESLMRSQREALKLHGLSDRQIDSIGNEGSLLRNLQIVAPTTDQHEEGEELRLSQTLIRPVGYFSAHDTPLIVDSLQVHKGQAVDAGEMLCSLSDFTELFIEGKAFEQDIAAVTNALKQDWPIQALFPSGPGHQAVSDLKIVFVSNSIDEDSRTLSFFVTLPNEIVRDETDQNDQRFISWKYRPGQRLKLRVPIEQWENVFVLPAEAVVKDGADWFVFQQHGDHFDRTPVHVRHRDQISVVIANDQSLKPGTTIALKSVHLMQMALKNQSGGGVGPHAGHTH